MPNDVGPADGASYARCHLSHNPTWSRFTAVPPVLRAGPARKKRSVVCCSTYKCGLLHP